MSAGLAVAVAAAGAVGALARYGVDGLVRARAAGHTPWGTITVNVSGSLLLGLLAGLVIYQGSPDALRTVAGTGFCGGYTTFSAASVEAARLLRARRWAGAAWSGPGTLLLTIGAGALGLLLARL